MIDKKELDELVWSILRGFPSGFKTCSLIQEAVDYIRVIHKTFWTDEEKGGYGILGMHNLTKAEMRKMREEVIARLITELENTNSEEKMYSDNFSRLFHALTLLKVPKNDARIHGTCQNFMYNIAYDLWALDDGSDKVWNMISSISWYAAEATKNASTSDLIVGIRHNFA